MYNGERDVQQMYNVAYVKTYVKRREAQTCTMGEDPTHCTVIESPPSWSIFGPPLVVHISNASLPLSFKHLLNLQHAL